MNENSMKFLVMASAQAVFTLCWLLSHLLGHETVGLFFFLLAVVIFPLKRFVYGPHSWRRRARR